ncbi:hypothetical protein BD309DRAFT_1019387 [Dichomitus squalens]|nr:hypothetical protein BD309DRAFT_1019387 [Dichomitus squalens]
MLLSGYSYHAYTIHSFSPENILQASSQKSLVTLPTQVFFVMRIWNFSNKHWLAPLVFLPCSLFQLAGYIVFLVICLNGGPTAHIIFKLPMAFWGVQAAEDVLISLTLIYLLWTRRVSNGFKSTDRLLYRLTMFVINTGVWTALCALFTIITLVAYPNVQIYVSLNFVVCPLYCNTLLANLNARRYIRGGDFNDPTRSTLQTITFAPAVPSRLEFSGGRRNQTSRTEVHELSIPSFAKNSSLKSTDTTMEIGKDPEI